MCGRFVGFRNIEELIEHFPIDISNVEVTANFNVAPSQEILAIIRHDKQNHLEKLHWGLVPFWANDTTIGNRMINARSETVATKPSFRTAFKKRRCLISGRLISVDEVCYFKAEDKYTVVKTITGESLIKKSIRQLAADLDPDQFWRIHRGTIINVNFIDRINRSFAGRLTIKLEDLPETLTVSRSYSHLFKQI